MALRPGLKPLVDFLCRDDGDGPYLVDGSMVNPPTQAEVDALTTAQLDASQREKGFHIDTLLARALFNHENRIRALAGQQPVTIVQFISVLKQL